MNFSGGKSDEIVTMTGPEVEDAMRILADSVRVDAAGAMCSCLPLARTLRIVKLSTLTGGKTFGCGMDVA